MADERKYYVLCADNCRFEAMTKEQTLAAIAQAVETGEIKDVDAGFVTKIKEKNGGKQVTIWVGTQAEYNAISTPDVNCLYIITDDSTVQEMQNAILALQNAYDEIASANVVVDVSSSTTLVCSTSHVSISEFTKKYIYSKALGIVFFNVSFDATFSQAVSVFGFNQTGGIIPEVNTPRVVPATAYVSGTNASAIYSTYTMQGVKHAQLNVNLDSAIEGQKHFDVCGWYFAQEETT